jgi:uncharacterized protein (UPF0332 family)
MSITPNDLLSQAKALLASSSSELECRNCIGRAYYAAFHTAKVFHASLTTHGKKPREATGIHAELAYQLSNPTISHADPRFRNSQSIGRHLSWLHDKRVKADYRLDATITKTDAEQVVQRVERVVVLAKWQRP